MNIKLLRLILAASITMLMSPTAVLAEDANTIVVGQAIDLSSPNANIGRDYVAGIKTYFDALNAAGGIDGKKIRYVVKDDQGVPAVAAKMATELIERDQADFLLGGVGDNVTQAILNAPAFARSNLVLYAPLVDALDINNPRILYWRPGYTQEVRHILTHFGQLGMKDVAVAYQDTAAAQSAFQKLSGEVRARGLRLTGTVRISGNERQNDPSQIAGLAASNPGFVIVIADTFGTAFFLKEFRKSAPQTFVAGTSLINLETLREVAGARAVEWTVFSQVVSNPTAGKTSIQLEHMNMIRKYRDEPASSLTFEGFVAAKTLVKAIQRSKRPPRAVLQDLMAQDATIDLGGMTASFSPKDNHLSAYLDIALFKKNALVF
jgi:ABC-type branched-subunit amino acid transport system substrate-binding protein